MAWLKGFTYDGIDSLDYDLYITSGSVYDAPERVVDMIKVPGRNGNLAIDQGRFENIDVEYNVYTKNRSQTSFAQNIRDFRNELCSRHEYLRLTDDYNSDEFRLGIYKSGLELDADIDRAGAIKLTFDCKPQRFLTSGETEKSIPDWSDVHSDSGNLVTIDNSGGEYAVKSLSTAIVPQQDLHGYDNPWAAGAGKNKFPELSATQTISDVTATKNSDGSITLSGTATATTYFDIDTNFNTTAVAGYYFSGIPSPCPYGNGLRFRISNSTSDRTALNDYYVSTSGVVTGGVINDNGSGKCLSIRVASGTAITTPLKLYPMISAAQDDTFAPYENICPITGFSSANIYVSPTTSVGDATTYNISFGSAGTVYGGTLDVVTGELESCPYYSSYNGEALTGEWISDRDAYAVGTTPTTGAQVVNIGGTLTTYQLTATQVAFLLGTNNIWSNTGDIQIEYGKGGNTLYNPTLFDSRPLIELTGAGTLGINNYIITITGSGKLYIDCDTMEAYTITGGIVTSANNRVSLNTTDYPVLRSGINSFAVGTGISNVKITPRWWRV